MRNRSINQNKIVEATILGEGRRTETNKKRTLPDSNTNNTNDSFLMCHTHTNTHTTPTSYKHALAFRHAHTICKKFYAIKIPDVERRSMGEGRLQLSSNKEGSQTSAKTTSMAEMQVNCSKKSRCNVVLKQTTNDAHNACKQNMQTNTGKGSKVDLQLPQWPNHGILVCAGLDSCAHVGAAFIF